MSSQQGLLNKLFFKQILFCAFTVWTCFVLGAQDTNTVNKRRLKTVLYSSGITYGVGMFGLNELWYKKEPRSGFHFFNDNREWQQVDKLGHTYTAFNQSLLGVKLMKWSGLPHKKAVLYGGLAGVVFQTPIEFLDAYSSAWGFSWGDVGANLFGASLATTQLYFWSETRITMKYSFCKSGLADNRPNVLGENLMQQLLKDYNGQTYWLSANVKSFFPESKLPDWFSVAVGMGAHNMIKAHKEDNVSLGYNAHREWYLSPDISFRKVKTKRKGLKAFLWLLDAYKFPFPALKLAEGRFLFSIKQ